MADETVAVISQAMYPGAEFDVSYAPWVANYGAAAGDFKCLGGVKDFSVSVKVQKASVSPDNRAGVGRSKEWVDDISAKGKMLEMNAEREAVLNGTTAVIVARVPGVTDGTAIVGAGDKTTQSEYAIRIRVKKVNVAPGHTGAATDVYNDILLEIPKATLSREGDSPEGHNKPGEIGFHIQGDRDDTVTNAEHRIYRKTYIATK